MPPINRPQFRNIHVTDLARYRLPLAGVVSILHRISGLIMFALLPFLLYLLETSLTSDLSFAALHDAVQSPLAKLIILALSWAYLHHFCAGVRHLLMDGHVGVDKDSARKSAAVVLVISVALALLVALKLFGVF